MKIGTRGEIKKNLISITKFKEYEQFSRKSIDELFSELDTSFEGLSDDEREKRIELFGLNEPGKKVKRSLILEILLKFLTSGHFPLRGKLKSKA